MSLGLIGSATATDCVGRTEPFAPVRFRSTLMTFRIAVIRYTLWMFPGMHEQQIPRALSCAPCERKSSVFFLFATLSRPCCRARLAAIRKTRSPFCSLGRMASRQKERKRGRIERVSHVLRAGMHFWLTGLRDALLERPFLQVPVRRHAGSDARSIVLPARICAVTTVSGYTLPTW